MGKKVLVVDSGGRGHALAWKLAQSSQVEKLFVAPGNGGTSRIAINVPIKVAEIDKLLAFAKQEGVDLTVVGSEDSLAEGIVDLFQQHELKIFGPTMAAAEVEANKAYAKAAMLRAHVPTAQYRVFNSVDFALNHVRRHPGQFFVKASGLALGKGAYGCNNVAEGQKAIAKIMVERVHGDAGKIVVIEEFVDGPEVSIHALSDGKNFVMFPTSQDHKPALNYDLGKNTGGMGTIAPVPWTDSKFLDGVSARVVQPMLDTMAADGRPFVGCLYPGLKVSLTEGAKVLEFNARPGDPETQVYMRLFDGDLFSLLMACVDGNVALYRARWSTGFAACVIMASGGYPDDYKKGFPISGIEQAEKIPGVVVFHSGTAWENGVLKTAGGRVLGVTAVGKTLREALLAAYEGVTHIHFEGAHYRVDIGQKSLDICASR